MKAHVIGEQNLDAQADANEGATGEQNLDARADANEDTWEVKICRYMKNVNIDEEEDSLLTIFDTRTWKILKRHLKKYLVSYSTWKI